MKWISLFAFLVLALDLGTGCAKDKNNQHAIDKTELAGTWELRQAQGGMMPAATYPAGNGNLLKFTQTTYERYEKGSLQKSGSYQLVSDTTAAETVGLQLPAGQFNTRIVFDNDRNAQKTFVDLREGRLQVVSGFFPADGGSWQIYEKTTDAPKSVQ
jgi:hypothetical protein